MRLIKICRYSLVLLFFSNAFFAQEIAWTTFQDLEDSMRIKKKPVIVKVETSWCGYCKMMDKKVFQNKRVVKRLKDNYYFVRLDGEGKKPLTFNGEQYIYIKHSNVSGIHQLASFLGSENGRISYPTLVALNWDLSINKRIVGYLDKNRFLYWLETSEE